MIKIPTAKLSLKIYINTNKKYHKRANEFRIRAYFKVFYGNPVDNIHRSLHTIGHKAIWEHVVRNGEGGERKNWVVEKNISYSIKLMI